MTDRVARRPSGRKARETYGADDAHAFLWDAGLEALAACAVIWPSSGYSRHLAGTGAWTP